MKRIPLTKKIVSLVTILLLVLAALYLPGIIILSRVLPADRPLFSNRQLEREGFVFWEIPHLQTDRNGWQWLLDIDRNIVVVFIPSHRESETYSIQPPRSGENILRIWINHQVRHVINVVDSTVYLVRPASWATAPAPVGLALRIADAAEEVGPQGIELEQILEDSGISLGATHGPPVQDNEQG